MSVNRVFLVGSLGQDPKSGQTQNGKDYANFSLATSKKWKDQNGDKKEETAWHNISCFGNIAKLCQYLEKGSKIFVEGEIKYEKYTDKTTGEEKIATKILANGIDIIKGKDREEGVSKHVQDKGNGFQPQVEEESDEIPF